MPSLEGPIRFLTTSIRIRNMRGALANGAEIRAARVRRGLTQEQLAGLAEMDVKTVWKAERGQRMDVKTLFRLALTLDVDVESLIR